MTQRRPSRVYSDGARRRSIQVPREGKYIHIKSVIDIYTQVRMRVDMVSNVWSLAAPCTTAFRLALPGLARVHVASRVFTVPGFLLQDLESVLDEMPRQSQDPWSMTAQPKVHGFRLRFPSPYFSQIVLLIKLRWLLKLHAACCELDYKVCSFKNVLLGMQYVVLQQQGDRECDNVFDSKVSQHIGDFLNLDSLFDDIVDQLQRALGVSWRPFVEYVSTCDANQAVHFSLIESMCTPKVFSTDGLGVVIDTIFLANFMRQRREGASHLREFNEDCRRLGVAVLEVPPLRGARDLVAWATSQTNPTLKSRKAGTKESEKLAQLDAVLLTAAVELGVPEVIAEPCEVEDRGDEEAYAMNTSPVDAALTAPDVPGKRPGSAGPPAARVIPQEKPLISPSIFEAAESCIHHHDTFPTGLRERLYTVLTSEYYLTPSQLEKLAISSTQNIDGKRLSESVMMEIVEREKSRLRQYSADYFVDMSHLLEPALVQSHFEKGKLPKYLTKHNPGTPAFKLAKSKPRLRDI